MDKYAIHKNAVCNAGDIGKHHQMETGIKSIPHLKMAAGSGSLAAHREISIGKYGVLFFNKAAKSVAITTKKGYNKNTSIVFYDM